MLTNKQKKASKRNIKKSQAAWKGMTSRQHALAQPQGRGRARPGEVGAGEYFRIVVRSKDEFVTFRYHDVGENDGDLQRLAGKRRSGSWDTQAWLISKKSAHVSGDKLIPDSADAKNLLRELGSEPAHIKGDIFKAKDRPNVPEEAKPTPAMRKAQQRNIRKAQQARFAQA